MMNPRPISSLLNTQPFTHWGDAKVSKANISLTFKENFFIGTLLALICYSVCMHMCICYGKAGRNAAFLDF